MQKLYNIFSFWESLTSWTELRDSNNTHRREKLLVFLSGFVHLINYLKHQGAFFRSKFHLNNYVQEEHKRKKVYKQTCLILGLERIPQYVPKITSRKKNINMCVWTHRGFFRPQLSHTFETLGVSENATKPNEITAKRFTFLWDFFLEWYIHFLNQDAFRPQGLLGGWVEGWARGGQKGAKAVKTPVVFI